jgi:hypothetical protein
MVPEQRHILLLLLEIYNAITLCLYPLQIRYDKVLSPFMNLATCGASPRIMHTR